MPTVKLGTNSVDFYPRPPRGGRPQAYRPKSGSGLFLPTPSARRATEHFGQQRDRQPISTHALREEGDSATSRKKRLKCNFYPRPPRGGRPDSCPYRL